MVAAVTSRPVFAVSLTVLLGLVSALTLKEAADQPGLSLVAGALVMLVVLGANAGRFFIWGFIYRRHPVSLTYPLGSTIFPLILLVGHVAYDEPATLRKVVASLMVMTGVAVLSQQEQQPGAELPAPTEVATGVPERVS